MKFTLRLRLVAPVLSLTLLLPAWALDDANQRDLINQAIRNEGLQKADAGSLDEDGGSYATLTSAQQKKLITWRGVANVAGDYLSNANFRNNSGDGSGVFTMSGESGLRATLAKGLEIDASIRSEAAFYTSIDNADYWGISSAVELQYTPCPYGPQIYAGPQLYRYETFNRGEEISRGVAPYIGLRKNHAFEKTRTYLFADYEFAHHFVTPSVDDRDVHAVVVGVTQEIIPKFYAQAYYQFQYSDYENIGRSDLRHLVGVGLIYQFNKYVLLRLGGTYSDNDSTANFASYQNFSAGLASTFRYEF